MAGKKFMAGGIILLLAVIVLLSPVGKDIRHQVKEFINPSPETLLKRLHVPEAGEKISDQNIAVPNYTYDSTGAKNNKIRVFNLKAAGDSFSPNKIIVNRYDVVRIYLASTDKTYDLTIPAWGNTITVAKGDTKLLEFQANSPGTFPFTCQKCDKETKHDGTIAVKPAS